jgi:photosystem II stability/assembly factor-like uncharacterized protein
MSGVLLLIGTKRGLFIARSDERRADWTLSAPMLAGREVYHAVRDPRDGSLWAATSHTVWGAHVHRSDDDGRTWHLLEAAPHHADDRGLRAIWALAPGSGHHPGRIYAGVEPAGLFVSEDRGASWAPVDPLNTHPTTTAWQPAGGSLALHSVLTDPHRAGRLFCAVSAGGVYRSDDDGASWQPMNRGVRADFLPRPFPPAGQCVHKLRLHPVRPDRLYQQNHCGVWRSDDGAAIWTEITAGLPSDYGYALALHPRDPDTLFVVPEESSHMRTTVGGRLRVYRSTDAGASWHALTEGLPQENAYVSVLREGLCSDHCDPLGLYLGTSGGHVFASRDNGEHWHVIAGFMPRILCVAIG